MKQSLRVRTDGLRKAEELSVAVFLRFVGQSEAASWALSREAGADLVLRSLDAAQDLEEADGVVVAWVADDDASVPADGRPVLRRPLQVEAFGALLRARETWLASQGAINAPLMQDTATVTAAYADGTVTATLAAPLSAPDTAAYPAFDVEATHRLLRWPGNDVLLDQRHRKILASFLVSRHLSTLQLSSLSGIGQHTCIDFLQSLTAAGLLDSRAGPQRLPQLATIATDGPVTIPILPGATEPAASTAAAGLAPTAPTSTAPAFANAGSLIGRLRKRLGL